MKGETAQVNPSWSAKVAESINSQDALPREMDWGEAQMWSNFILMKPTILPSDGKISALSMRAEAPPGRVAGREGDQRPLWTPSNRSCHRFELVGTGRRLRAKQFLYDWAPPAFDHPSLWRNRPKAFFDQENICWIGANYRKEHAASLHRMRTMIEVSVVQGEYTDQELFDFCSGFQPVCFEAQKAIGQTSLAHLCYQRRHMEFPVAVPTGYWSHRRNDLKEITQVVAPDELPLQFRVGAITPPGYSLDTVFVWGDRESPREVEFVFTVLADKGDYVRLIACPSKLGAAAEPPFLDEQPCDTETLHVDSYAVYHAYLSREFGPHEAWWRSSLQPFICLVKPNPYRGFGEFNKLLEVLVFSSTDFALTIV